MRKLNLSAEGDNFLGEIIIPDIPERTQEYLSHAINMIFDMNDTVLDISNIITTEMLKFTPNKHLVHELDTQRTTRSIHNYVYAFNGEDGKKLSNSYGTNSISQLKSLQIQRITISMRKDIIQTRRLVCS